MKKISQILCTAAVVLTFCACGSKNQFTVTGIVDIPELEGQKVYMIDMNKGYNPVSCGDDIAPADSALIVDGRFIIKGTVDEPWMAMIGCPESPFIISVIIEPGDIVATIDSIGGTPLNDQLYAARNNMNSSDLDEELDTYLQLYYNAPNAEVRANAERLYDSVDAIRIARELDANWKLYNDNPDNVLGVHAMEQIVAMSDFTYSELDSIVKAASPRLASNKLIQSKLEQLSAVEQTSVGKHYTDIIGVDGKLSDIIDGKLALVDFYASWCGPCRNEIKDNLVPLWAKYKNRGLVIVGLNVWERGNAAARKAAHEKVMADLGITYPQLVDSTRTATNTYGVEGIPQILLIGPDGTILARDLRGAAIEEAIIKAL